MTSTRSDTRSVGDERVRFRRASAKPERCSVPKAGQRRESESESESESEIERVRERKEKETERDRMPVESTFEHSMFARTFDGDLTAYGNGCFSMDGRSRRTIGKGEEGGKGKGRESRGSGLRKRTYRARYMRLVIHHERPGAR